MAKTNPMYKDTVFRMLFKEPKEALNLYEHQSTPNPNMPLRDLYNVSGELQRIFPAKNLYGRTKKAIPVPRFVVFYNGVEAQAEKFSYRLSYRKR